MKRNELLIPISELNYSNYFHFLTSAMRHLRKVIVQLQEKKEAALSTLSTPEVFSTNMFECPFTMVFWGIVTLYYAMELLQKNAQPLLGYVLACCNRMMPR